MCDQIRSIFQAIEFIESHLQEEITVAQIANAAGYSLFHFVRKFNQIVHHTPYDYLMRRRLTEAAETLIHSKRRIIDIAQDYCFNDQETFSRLFRKMFQMTPSQCRKENGISFQYLLQAKTMVELKFINSDHFVTPLIVEKDDLHLLGLMTALDEEPKSATYLRQQVCNDLLSECSLFEKAIIYEIEYLLNPHNERPYYFVGVEKSFFEQNSELLVSYTVSKGRFVKMEVPEADLSLASAYIHSTWIPLVGLMSNENRVISCWEKETKSKRRMITLLIPVC